MDTMIEISGVTKRFGGFVAVAGVDLKIQAGEFITLLGPSGCGKTTLLRMLSGFESPTEGQIRIGGIDVTRLPPYRRNVNQVFQSYALFPHLNVRENIAFGLKMQKIPREEIQRRVEEAMAMVALTGLGERRPAQLSGGQRQRVALARALVPRPDVLLLDEPLSALDAKLRHSVQLELKELQHRLGLTFVFVTHDQEEALVMSDRIAVMKSGCIEQLGTSVEIYRRPRTAFVADFIGEANLLHAELVRRDEAQGRARVKVKGGLELEVSLAAWPVSANALISIRPEKLLLSKQPPPAFFGFPARVVEEVFQGPITRLVLVAAQSTRLIAVVANESSFRETVHQGDDVHVGLHPDDLVIVNGLS